jgi:hypothetical protein
MSLKHALRSLALITVTAVVTFPALAQWQWIDKDGRRVFSDQAPPTDIREKDIVKRPGGRLTPAPVAAVESDAVPAAQTPSVKASAAAAPKLSGTDKELEARKKQAEAEDAAKKKAEADKLAKSRADSCDRAKRALTTLESGIRIGVTNAAGEREVMDDAKRAAETKRTKDIADSNCK